MLRDKPEDAEVLAYCEDLVEALTSVTAFGQPVRALLDTKKIKSAEKRWNWVRRGAPIIVEIGPRDAAGGQVTYMRRDDLRDGDKVKSIAKPREDFLRRRRAAAGRDPGRPVMPRPRRGWTAISRRDITTSRRWRPISRAATIESSEFKGWVRAPWSKPTGAELEAIDAKLKALKLTMRNAPLDQPETFGPCIFTGTPGVEEILISRAY